MAYIDSFFALLIFFAGYWLDKYGLLPGRIINKDFVLIIVSYAILLVSCVIKFFLIKNNIDIKALKDERDCYKKIVIETSDKSIEKIRNKTMQAAKKLQFYTQPHKMDRITIYALLNDSFFALSRFSLNPAYQKITPDKQYPLDKGCIALGYKDGFFYESGKNFPDPEKNFKEYEDYTRNHYNYSHTDVKSMSMHSTCYAVKRIYKEDKCLGVIVLESIQKNRFNEEDAKEQLDQLASKIYYLLDLLDIKVQEVSKKITNKQT